MNILCKKFGLLSGGIALVMYASGCTSGGQQASSDEKLEETQQETAQVDEASVAPEAMKPTEAMDQTVPEKLEEAPLAAETDAKTPVEESAPVPAGATGDAVQYIVVKGDSLSKIAARVYGDKFKWTVLASSNSWIKNPNHIFPGDIVSIPLSDDKAKGFAKAYEAKKAETRVVEKVKAGDTLEKIAQRVLGNGADWKVIWQMNRDALKNPNMIKVGQALNISTGLAHFMMAH